ncbi:MAG: iron ABC transporter permease [Fusicatenibacter sp.]|nr:iron ABC transporter permease [Lachnospiraceae bacterium]MDY2936718.1 iron ABC transporter permease [Fusicatenibacter sp.]
MKIRFRKLKFGSVMALAVAALFISFIVGVVIGAVHVDPDWILKIVVNEISGREVFQPEWSSSNEAIIWELRIPRVLLALLVGVGLSLSGVLMQALTKNSLADPYVLGISSGASAGAVLVIMTSALAFMPKYRTMAGAFAGAVLAIIIAVKCATIHNRVTATQLVLSGVAVSALFSAITNVIIYCSPESSKTKTALFWMVGSLSGATWEQVIAISVICLVCVVLMLLLSSSLDVLMLGDETASNLGLNIRRIKFLIIILCTVLTGSIVAVSGVIGFVGLVIPHIARLFVGSTHRKLIPATILIGGVFVIWSDIISRVIVAPEELPIGVVTSCIGAPFFLWLLRKNSRSLGGK